MYTSWFLCDSSSPAAYDPLRDAMEDRHKEYDERLMFSETMRLDGQQSLTKVAGVDDDWKAFIMGMYASIILTIYDKETHKDIFDYIYTDAWQAEDE